MRSELFEPLSLVSNIYMGYDLESALSMVKRAGFDFVEIASIVGSCIHILPEEMTPEKARHVKAALEKNALSSYAFAGHADLTDDKQLADFLIKMRFASDIGAVIINTNTGPVGRKRVFFRNMPKVIALAEKLGLIVCLESHGDIIDTAKSAVPVMEAFNHPLVRLNYDTGNTCYSTKGRVDIAEDLKYGLPYLQYIHLKDIHIEGEYAWYRPLGGGDIDFAAVFRTLARLGRPIACGLEIPVFVEGAFDALSTAKSPLPINVIDQAVRTSVGTICSLSPESVA